jgi:hypothetical protein
MAPLATSLRQRRDVVVRQPRRALSVAREQPFSDQHRSKQENADHEQLRDLERDVQKNPEGYGKAGDAEDEIEE